MDDVDRLLAEANPVPPGTVRPGALDARARADLAVILRSAPGRARRASVPTAAARPRRRTLLAAAGVVAATAAGLVGTGVVQGPLGGGRAFAATPPLLTFEPLPASSGDAAAVLRGIAARICALPDDSGSGRYAMIAAQSWYLWSRIDGAQVTSTVVPADTTTWTAADGSGFERSTFRRPGEDTRTEERRYAAGEHGFMWPLRSLSADDRTLARQLEQGHPVSDGPAERLVAVEDAYGEQVLPPAVRAAVLRYVAATPGMALRGRGHDRLGRPGIAVSLDSAYSGLPTRYTLVVDERSGRLLDWEEMLTTSAGKLNVRVPSVIGYTALRESRFTGEAG